jgi:hypothetical protein
VDRLALVELEPPLAAALDHARVLVLGLVVPKDARAGRRLDRPDRHGQQERDPDRGQDEAPPSAGRRTSASASAKARKVRRVPDERDEQQRAEEDPGQRAEVEIA